MIESVEWKYIYQCKLLDIPDKHQSDFNYKLLNNILCNNVFLSKWKRDTHSNCENCHIRETTKHIIFECENVVQVWNALSNYLNLNVKWKHIMVGFFHERNRKTKSLNLLISYIAYRIYKYKMYCRLNSLDETRYNIFQHVKFSVMKYAKILKNLNVLAEYRLFEKFVLAI